jgi:exodeoxyribonuclease VII small subunit
MTDDVATLSFEAALAELDALITRLEGGSVDLEEAIACYERGAQLAQRCAELLDRTEAKVMQLVVGAGGAQEERPFTPGADVAPAPAAATPRAPKPAGGRPSVPPPPSAPVRARPVEASDLFRGLEPSPAKPRPGEAVREGEGESGFELDDIPF